MIVIGIDPDAKKHGFAEYHDGKLIDIKSMQLTDILGWINEERPDQEILFSIEDVCSRNSVNADRLKGIKQGNAGAIGRKMALGLGWCQQSQVELMRVLDYFSIRYVLHKPQRGNWAKNKAQFEKVTGWTKRSNEDTRSAAFFGFLAIK